MFGRGEIARLRELVPGGARVLVTYGQGSVLRNGVLDQVRCALADHARLFEFGGIEANPACETLDQAIALGREERVDWILLSVAVRSSTQQIHCRRHGAPG